MDRRFHYAKQKQQLNIVLKDACMTGLIVSLLNGSHNSLTSDQQLLNTPIVISIILRQKC